MPSRFLSGEGRRVITAALFLPAEYFDAWEPEVCIELYILALATSDQSIVTEQLIATERDKMVPLGLEPRTLRLLAVRSNQLSYETLEMSANANNLFVLQYIWQWLQLGQISVILNPRSIPGVSIFARLILTLPNASTIKR